MSVSARQEKTVSVIESSAAVAAAAATARKAGLRTINNRDYDV